MPAALRSLFLAIALVGCRSHDGNVTELWFGGDVHASARLGALLDSVPLRRDAIGVVNLEGPVADGPSSTIDVATVRLRQSPRTPALLAKAGVRVATLANNHALDEGEPGRAHTEERLRATGIDVAFGDRVAVLRGAGATVSITAFDLGAASPDDVRRVVAGASGVRVVSLHVTAGPSYLPTDALERAVRASLDAGARVVVAHGSHEPARVERRGDAIIAWGLGNLVFDCPCTEESDGLLLAVSVAQDGSVKARVLPIRAGLGGASARPADEPDVMRQLLVSLGSTKLDSEGLWFRF